MEDVESLLSQTFHRIKRLLPLWASSGLMQRSGQDLRVAALSPLRIRAGSTGRLVGPVQAGKLSQLCKLAPKKFIGVYSFYDVYKSTLSH